MPNGWVTSPGLDIGQARRKANVCARGAGNLILRLTPVTFEINNKKKCLGGMTPGLCPMGGSLVLAWT